METNVYTVRFRQREGSLQPEYVDTHVVLADTPENAESEVRAKLLRQGIGLVSLVDINILGTGRHINGELGVKAIKVSSVDRTWLAAATKPVLNMPARERLDEILNNLEDGNRFFAIAKLRELLKV